MSGSKKKSPAEELIESLLKDVGEDSASDSNTNALELAIEDEVGGEIEGLVLDPNQLGYLDPKEEALHKFALENDYAELTENQFQNSVVSNEPTSTLLKFPVDDKQSSGNELREALGALQVQEKNILPQVLPEATLALEVPAPVAVKNEFNPSPLVPESQSNNFYQPSDSDKTVAVAGYQVRSDNDYDDKVKVTVGQNRMSSGYSAWNSGGSADSNLAQAENLRIAQEKIIELERENEKVRQQNEELMAASEIIKERSDLLSQQISEYKNDREGLEASFKNEIVLLKNHLARKDAELQRSQFKSEELDSRLKFDMKKIRVRERELENRLELIRAEKNAIVKNKDEQILDLRRKMDILQMEVESYRQKCVDLNKSIESSQESFKRTTRALRLAMANLELQEENKATLKKVD